MGTLATAMKVGGPVFKIMKLAYPEPGTGGRRVTLHWRNSSRSKAGLGAVKAKPKAEEGNPKHLGAPMHGMVVTVAVKVGLKVAKGKDLLLELI